MNIGKTGKIRIAALLLAAVLLLPVLVSCGDGKEVISVVAAYIGPEVTTTDRVFTKDDFYVVASYADGTFEDPVPAKKYEFEMTGMEEGYYIFNFTYRGFTQEAFVKCNVPIYPSEMGGD